MDNTKPSTQVNLSLMSIIVFSILIGSFGFSSFHKWLAGELTESLIGFAVALLGLVPVLLYARKISRIIQSFEKSSTS